MENCPSSVTFYKFSSFEIMSFSKFVFPGCQLISRVNNFLLSGVGNRSELII